MLFWLFAPVAAPLLIVQATWMWLETRVGTLLLLLLLTGAYLALWWLAFYVLGGRIVRWGQRERGHSVKIGSEAQPP
jgi:hypothetical protein